MDLVREIEELVAQIPPGRVCTFSDIAEALGDPGAATAVFRVLRDSETPGAFRVVRASGAVPFAGAIARLKREGVATLAGSVQNLERTRFREFHGPRTLARLREEQLRSAAKVDPTDRFDAVESIAGFDVSYDGPFATAAAVVMDPAGDAVLQETALHMAIEFPYVPGYLAFREFPAIEACFRRLDPPPHLLMIDGHGILHPARFGIASFAGVALNRPTIGVAKSLLVGEPGRPPREAGGTTEVRLDGEVLGIGIRSGLSRRLIYVSVGHRISLGTAAKLTKRLCKARIPEPLRRAHNLATEEKRKWKKKR